MSGSEIGILEWVSSRLSTLPCCITAYSCLCCSTRLQWTVLVVIIIWWGVFSVPSNVTFIHWTFLSNRKIKFSNQFGHIIFPTDSGVTSVQNVVMHEIWILITFPVLTGSVHNAFKRARRLIKCLRVILCLFACRISLVRMSSIHCRQLSFL